MFHCSLYRCDEDLEEDSENSEDLDEDLKEDLEDLRVVEDSPSSGWSEGMLMFLLLLYSHFENWWCFRNVRN